MRNHAKGRKVWLSTFHFPLNESPSCNGERSENMENMNVGERGYAKLWSKRQESSRVDICKLAAETITKWGNLSWNCVKDSSYAGYDLKLFLTLSRNVSQIFIRYSCGGRNWRWIWVGASVWWLFNGPVCGDFCGVVGLWVRRQAIED